MADQNPFCVVSQHPTYPRRALKMPNVSAFVKVLLPVKTARTSKLNDSYILVFKIR